jgi:hypothetical protein
LHGEIHSDLQTYKRTNKHKDTRNTYTYTLPLPHTPQLSHNTALAHRSSRTPQLSHTTALALTHHWSHIPSSHTPKASITTDLTHPSSQTPQLSHITALTHHSSHTPQLSHATALKLYVKTSFLEVMSEIQKSSVFCNLR